MAGRHVDCYICDNWVGWETKKFFRHEIEGVVWFFEPTLLGKDTLKEDYNSLHYVCSSARQWKMSIVKTVKRGLQGRTLQKIY